MTEEQIIQGIRQGEETAFKELVDQYQELVINVCNSFLHNRDDALDVSQDVFIKAYHSIGSFRGQSRISTWLYRIAVNQSLNYIRDRKRKNIFNSLDVWFNNSRYNPAETLEDQDDIATEKMERQEQKHLLYKVIESLPKKQRVALTLNKLEELPYKEVAEIMDITVSETGVLINRAKKTLQKKMVAELKNTDRL